MPYSGTDPWSIARASGARAPYPRAVGSSSPAGLPRDACGVARPPRPSTCAFRQCPREDFIRRARFPFAVVPTSVLPRDVWAAAVWNRRRLSTSADCIYVRARPRGPHSSPASEPVDLAVARALLRSRPSGLRRRRARASLRDPDADLRRRPSTLFRRLSAPGQTTEPRRVDRSSEGRGSKDRVPLLVVLPGTPCRPSGAAEALELLRRAPGTRSLSGSRRARVACRTGRRSSSRRRPAKGDAAPETGGPFTVNPQHAEWIAPPLVRFDLSTTPRLLVGGHLAVRETSAFVCRSRTA